jgi:hypothetical protein
MRRTPGPGNCPTGTVPRGSEHLADSERALLSAYHAADGYRKGLPQMSHPERLSGEPGNERHRRFGAHGPNPGGRWRKPCAAATILELNVNFKWGDI